MKNVDVTKNQAVYATVDVAISYDIINGWPRRRHPDAGRPFPGPFWDVKALKNPPPTPGLNSS